MVSKVIDKATAVQLINHVTTHLLDERFQSAYKLYHSIETALVRVQNDILRAIDSKQSVILLLLDLSAAFDTVDHSIKIRWTIANMLKLNHDKTEPAVI